MPQYALFDSSIMPPMPVIGWYDTDLNDYPNLPDLSELLELGTDQWSIRLSQTWAVVDGTLVPYTPPPPVLTLQQQADLELSTRRKNGIAITSTSTSTLSGTMALDDVTMNQFGSVARDAASGLGLPGDMPVFVYPTIDGSPFQFNEIQVIAVYKAQRNLLLVLNTQAAMMAHGEPPQWPEQTAIIP
jgi:hypothetical protein